MDVRLTEEQELLRRSVREFAEAELRPHVREWDEAQGFPPQLLSKFADLGLMGIQFPEAYGGSAMSSVDYCICLEELARVGPALWLSIAAHKRLGSRLHLHRGPPPPGPGRLPVHCRAQRARLRPHLHVRHRGPETALSGPARAGRT